MYRLLVTLREFSEFPRSKNQLSWEAIDCGAFKKDNES